MNRLVEGIISNSRVVLAGLILLLMAGWVTYKNLPKEQWPDIQLPFIYIMMTLEGVSPDDAERLLDTIRKNRGLGEVRFARLLERNARMRRMVAPGVQVSQEEVAQAFRMLHGPKYRVRVIGQVGLDLVARRPRNSPGTPARHPDSNSCWAQSTPYPTLPTRL